MGRPTVSKHFLCIPWSAGQSELQCPHSPWPDTCTPLLSVFVEHHSLSSGSWVLVHPWYSIPSNEKGKTHFAPALPPPTVRHLPLPLEENPHCDWLRNPLRHALVSLSLPKHFLPWPNDSCNFFRVRVCSSIPLLHEQELHFPHWSHLQSESPESYTYKNSLLNTLPFD